jgi:hypothetical protein
MSKKRNRLEISGQFLQCPLLLSIDTYEGCTHGCRYCFVNYQYKRQTRGKEMQETVGPALLNRWERVLKGEAIGNPMIEYLVARKHPIQLGTKADPFPAGVEREYKNTRKFIELSNKAGYPAYICTKNPDPAEMPLDLLARGNYVLAVSLASHRCGDIRLLEEHTSLPMTRLHHIPSGVFKKVVVKWQPFIPQLFTYRNGSGEITGHDLIDEYLDAIAGVADALSISFLSPGMVKEPTLLRETGYSEMDELDEVELLTYIKDQCHRRNLEFYTANYRALSDSPVCCGLRFDEFSYSTPWVWGFLIHKLFTGEQEYLTEKDLNEAFPPELKNVIFHTANIPLFSRWARYRSKKDTILQEYTRNFTMDRKMNPVNYFAGLYSKIVDGEYRVYFTDYRKMPDSYANHMPQAPMNAHETIY